MDARDNGGCDIAEHDAVQLAVLKPEFRPFGKHRAENGPQSDQISKYRRNTTEQCG
jgi:hypothetical protein